MCGMTPSYLEARRNADDAARRVWSISNAMSEKPRYTIGETVYIKAKVEHVGNCGQIYVAIPMPGNDWRYGVNLAKLTPEMGNVYREKKQEPVNQTVVLEKE